MNKILVEIEGAFRDSRWLRVVPCIGSTFTADYWSHEKNDFVTSTFKVIAMHHEFPRIWDNEGVNLITITVEEI